MYNVFRTESFISRLFLLCAERSNELGLRGEIGGEAGRELGNGSLGMGLMF